MPPHTGTDLVRLKLVPPPGIPTESATITDRAPLAGAGSEIVTSFRLVPFLPFRAEWTASIKVIHKVSFSLLLSTGNSCSKSVLN